MGSSWGEGRGVQWAVVGAGWNSDETCFEDLDITLSTSQLILVFCCKRVLACVGLWLGLVAVAYSAPLTSQLTVVLLPPE